MALCNTCCRCIAAVLMVAVASTSAFSPAVLNQRRSQAAAYSHAIPLRSCTPAAEGRRTSSLRATGVRGTMCATETEQKIQLKLLRLAACTNRGQSATLDQKYDLENTISDLESSLSIVNNMNMATSTLLNGKWYLVYASERETRSSPFFWAFRKALKGVQQPIPMLPSELSESFFAITDGLPFYTVGRATQTISGVGTAGAQLVSSVQVTIRLFDALVPALDGFVTTTSDYRPIAGSKAQLSVKTTEVKESSLAQVPVFGQMFQDVKFPTSLALEQVKAGSSEVQLEHTYLSETLRIARNGNGQVFVYSKDDSDADPFGGFDEEFGADRFFDDDVGSTSFSSSSSSSSTAKPAAAAQAISTTTKIDLGLKEEAFSDGGPAWVEFTQFSEDVSPD